MQNRSKEKTNGHIFGVLFHQGAVSLKDRPVQAHQRGTFWELVALHCNWLRWTNGRNPSQFSWSNIYDGKNQPSFPHPWTPKEQIMAFKNEFLHPFHPEKRQKTSLEPSFFRPQVVQQKNTHPTNPQFRCCSPGFPCGIPTYPPPAGRRKLPREAPSWTWTNGTCSPWPTRTRWEQGGRPGEQQLGVLQNGGCHVSMTKKGRFWWLFWGI